MTDAAASTADKFLAYDEVGASQYVFPGDWEAHSAIWLSWQSEDHKRNHPVSVPQLQYIAGLHGHQKAYVIVQDEAEEKAVVAAAGKAKVALDHVTFYHAEHVGLWARDMGPQFSRSLITGKLAIVDWGFNQWGHEEPEEHDSATNFQVHRTLARQLNIPMIPVATNPTNNIRMIHEGGGVAHNGRGTMIAVESVAMQRNLGPRRFHVGNAPTANHKSPTSYEPSAEWDACRQAVEVEYARSLGVRKLIWFPTGVYEDEGTFRGLIATQFQVKEFEGKSITHPGVWTLYTTNGHGDEFVKFIAEDTVLLAQCELSSEAEKDTSPLGQMAAYIEKQNHERLERCAAIIQKQTTHDGKPLKLVRIPTAPLIFVTMEAGDPIYDYYRDYKHWDHPTHTQFPKDNAPMLAVLPTSYVNYLMTTQTVGAKSQHETSGAVLVARYWREGEGRPEEWRVKEEKAHKTIQAAFPGRTLVHVDIEPVNMGGGGIHCSSQQQPMPTPADQ